MPLGQRVQPLQRARRKRKAFRFFKTQKGNHFSELGINSNYNITCKDKIQRRLLKLRDRRLQCDTERGNAILFQFMEILSIWQRAMCLEWLYT